MADNKIGKSIKKSQKTIKKINELTEKVNNVNRYAVLISDGVQSIRSVINANDEELADIKKNLKASAKSLAYQKIKEEIPTEQEIIDFILKESCDVQVMNIVQEQKANLEFTLNKGDNTLKSLIKKFKKLEEKTEKLIEKLVDVTILLVTFQALITALEILIAAAKISLLAFTGVFASGVAIARISNAINNAEALVLKYTGAIKTYSFYALRVVNSIVSIFNFIPIAIELFESLRLQIQSLLKLVEQYYKEYILKCIPGGDVVNADGTLNIENINAVLNANTSNLNSSSTDVLGDYTRDGNTRRIFRPKIN